MKKTNKMGTTIRIVSVSTNEVSVIVCPIEQMDMKNAIHEIDVFFRTYIKIKSPNAQMNSMTVNSFMVHSSSSTRLI